MMEDECGSWLWIPSPWKHNFKSRKTLLAHTVKYDGFLSLAATYTQFTLGSLLIFSVDLSAEKFLKTINWSGVSAEVTQSTRKQMEY